MSTNDKTIATGLLFISPTLLFCDNPRPGLSRHIHACLARHRDGDSGLIGEPVISQNRAALSTSGTVISSYPLDPAKPIGEDGSNLLWIKTLAGWEETLIMLPHDLDREAEMIFWEEMTD